MMYFSILLAMFGLSNGDAASLAAVRTFVAIALGVASVTLGGLAIAFGIDLERSRIAIVLGFFSCIAVAALVLLVRQ